MNLRSARSDELPWINEHYAAADFVLSTERDTIVIAEVDGVRAGMGRLVPDDEGSAELGGMLVFEGHRGRGIARAIIERLLDLAAGRIVYCIPWADLEPIYLSAGFVNHDESGPLPAKVVEKLAFCREHYERPVLLLVQRR